MPEINKRSGPLLTLALHERMQSLRRGGSSPLECSLDLKRSETQIELLAESWQWNGRSFPYLETCKDRTIYYWDGSAFQPASRYTNALIKLVPTEWGPPTFEIDGIKMLPTERTSPYIDARSKVALVQPKGKVVLDTCGGLGYFAAWCVEQQAAQVLSFEKNADVLWLRSINSWSPVAEGVLSLKHADIVDEILSIADASVDAALHDPPRFGIAGELYSQVFYDQLARVLKRGGRLFHYTGTPNKLTTGRDLPNEVSNRLRNAGFSVEPKLDGVLAIRR